MTPSPARRGTEPSTSPRRAPVAVEPLEGRRLMSVSLVNSVLTVDGSVYEDIITVRQFGGQIAVTDSGPGYVFNASAVSRVVVFGNDGGDRIFVGPEVTKPTELHGGRGNDLVVGGGGQDWIWGDDGNDSLEGWGGNDYMFGGNGNDYMYGGDGNDYVAGQAGADRMYGQNGNDLLLAKGDGSSDVVDGGAGWDTAYIDPGLVLYPYATTATTSMTAARTTTTTTTSAFSTKTALIDPSIYFPMVGDSVYNCETVYT